MQSEKIIEKTPNGGVYSIITYLDNYGKVVDKKEATKCVIGEYDKDDNLIFETFGELEENN